MAQAVSPTRAILVAGVHHPAAPVGFQVRHQLGAAQIDERPDDVLTPRVNRGQAAGTGATHQPQQHRFCLIVARVPDGDDVGLPTLADALEKCVAGLARGLLQRTAPPGGDCGDVTGFDVETSARSLPPGARRTRRRGRTSTPRRPWFKCARPARCKHPGGRQFRHQQGQRHRIGPAGHGDDHARAVGAQRPASNGRQHPAGK